MNKEIMSLDIKIGYEEILKNEKILDNLTVGKLKGIHYRLHNSYNRLEIKNRIKRNIYIAHQKVVRKMIESNIDHKILDNLDKKHIKKIIEKKKVEIKKRQVFLLRKSIRKNG